MTAKLYTIDDIQAEMRADGSHWWDPDTMRFFGTRVCGAVYQGDDGIFFVTSEWNGPRGKEQGRRAYTLRQYKPQEKQVDTVGEVCQYDNRRTAQRAAEKSAGANCVKDGSPLTRVTVRDQFIFDCRKNGNPKAFGTVCDRLRTAAKRHHRMMEQACNGRDVYDSEGEPLAPLKRNRHHITALAKDVGAIGVNFDGDPRGFTVKLVFPTGANNTWGQDGYGVPGS